MNEQRQQGTTASKRWARHRPKLVVEITLEELPLLRVEADSAEDEARLFGWARCPSSRQRILEALDNAFNEDGRWAA